MRFALCANACLSMENISTTPPTYSLHIAAIDREPGFAGMVNETMALMNVDASELQLNKITEETPDWNIIYPVDQCAFEVYTKIYPSKCLLQFWSAIRCLYQQLLTPTSRHGRTPSLVS